MKKTLFNYLGVLLCAVALFTSCSKDDDAAPVDSPVKETTFADNSGLTLTYSGAPMIGKQVTFTPDAAHPGKATLVLKGAAFDSSVLPVASKLADTDMGNLATAGVIPGEASTTIQVEYQADGDKVSFEGTDNQGGRAIQYKGEATASAMKLELNVTMPANDLQGKTLTLAPADGTSPAPFHVLWTQDDPQGNIPDMNGLLQLVFPNVKVNGQPLPQLLAGVFQKVEFLPDGNIRAAYKDKATDAEWKTSPLNLAMYSVGSDQTIRVYLNVAQIMAQAAQPKGRAADLSAVLAGLLPTFLPMLSEGVPVHYTFADNSCTLYLGYDVFAPVLKAVKPLFQDEATVNALVELIKANAVEMGQEEEAFLQLVLTQMPQIIDSTTDVQVGLQFIPATQQ